MNNNTYLRNISETSNNNHVTYSKHCKCTIVIVCMQYVCRMHCFCFTLCLKLLRLKGHHTTAATKILDLGRSNDIRFYDYNLLLGTLELLL